MLIGMLMVELYSLVILQTRIISSSEQMYLQSGLQLNVQYSVYMVALGDYGSSQPSETFIFTLLPGKKKWTPLGMLDTQQHGLTFV